MSNFLSNPKVKVIASVVLDVASAVVVFAPTSWLAKMAAIVISALGSAGLHALPAPASDAVQTLK